jgi:hypothetical protein
MYLSFLALHSSCAAFDVTQSPFAGDIDVTKGAEVEDSSIVFLK